MAVTSPACRLLVGAALRRYREDAGYTLKDVARILQCDASKISRLETGQRGIRAKELRELLSECGTAEPVTDVLTALADPRGAHGWWKAFAGALPAAWQDRLALTSAASHILLYEAQRIPELLQTGQYARALAQADLTLKDDEARELAVAATLALQKARSEAKADVHVILGEAALRQRAGDATVMEGQLRLLAGVSGDSGRVTVQVLPFGSGTHAAPCRRIKISASLVASLRASSASQPNTRTMNR